MNREKAIGILWDVVSAYSEDSLGNRIDVDEETGEDQEYKEEFEIVCLALNTLINTPMET